jgi:hypothetical protein
VVGCANLFEILRIFNVEDLAVVYHPMFRRVIPLTLAMLALTFAAGALRGFGGDDLKTQLERLKRESPGEYDKVVELLKTQRSAAIEFLNERFGKRAAPAADQPPDKGTPQAAAGPTKGAAAALPARKERFSRIETVSLGGFSIDLCRREDGAFGLGEIRKGKLPLRRADFLITWQVAGKFPAFERREGLTIHLREPKATLSFMPEKRECAGTTFDGFHMQFKADAGPLVETASWELGGSTRGLSYFDGYRGWHGPPQWLAADAVAETNPKLTPSLLHGTGFQFEHGAPGALVHFHTTPGDRLRNVSRGEALEFQTTFHGPTSVDRYLLVISGDSRINLWTRACEVTYAEIRRALELPPPSREILLQWPPFSRKGFRETAQQCVAATAREGFSGASIDVIWDNADFHGGAKNMNVWDYTVCAGYGGPRDLRFLVDECKKHKLRVVAWVPSGHLWDRSGVWRDHPDWLLRRPKGGVAASPAGPVYGDLSTGFGDYYRQQVVRTVRDFGLDGLWLDSHLSYAQQYHPPDHAARLLDTYRQFIRAGARHLMVEGDASAIGTYGIGIGEGWKQSWGQVPGPDLYYGATLMCGANEPRFYLEHFRRYVASGAMWVIDWDFLFSTKLSGEDIDAARSEIRQVLADYRRVKDRMVHRFVHADGSGYTWINDADQTKVVWLLANAPLPDGRRGQARRVYVVPAK